MAAPFEASRGVGRGPTLPLRTERFRALLLTVMERHTAEFERHAETLAALTANRRQDTTDRARAIAALRMFTARAAIERISDAIERVDEGSYAICQSCGRPTALDRLEVIPHAQLCAVCDADSVTALLRLAGAT